MLTCRLCGAEIVWCETPRGKRIAVNAAQDPTGDVFVITDDHPDPRAFAWVDIPEDADDSNTTTHTLHRCPPKTDQGTLLLGET